MALQPEQRPDIEPAPPIEPPSTLPEGVGETEEDSIPQVGYRDYAAQSNAEKSETTSVVRLGRNFVDVLNASEHPHEVLALAHSYLEEDNTRLSHKDKNNLKKDLDHFANLLRLIQDTTTAWSRSFSEVAILHNGEEFILKPEDLRQPAFENNLATALLTSVKHHMEVQKNLPHISFAVDIPKDSQIIQIRTIVPGLGEIRPYDQIFIGPLTPIETPVSAPEVEEEFTGFGIKNDPRFDSYVNYEQFADHAARLIRIGHLQNILEMEHQNIPISQLDRKQRREREKAAKFWNKLCLEKFSLDGEVSELTTKFIELMGENDAHFFNPDTDQWVPIFNIHDNSFIDDEGNKKEDPTYDSESEGRPYLINEVIVPVIRHAIDQYSKNGSAAPYFTIVQQGEYWRVDLVVLPLDWRGEKTFSPWTAQYNHHFVLTSHQEIPDSAKNEPIRRSYLSTDEKLVTFNDGEIINQIPQAFDLTALLKNEFYSDVSNYDSILLQFPFSNETPDVSIPLNDHPLEELEEMLQNQLEQMGYDDYTQLELVYSSSTRNGEAYEIIDTEKNTTILRLTQDRSSSQMFERGEYSEILEQTQRELTENKVLAYLDELHDRALEIARQVAMTPEETAEFTHENNQDLDSFAYAKVGLMLRSYAEALQANLMDIDPSISELPFVEEFLPDVSDPLFAWSEAVKKLREFAKETQDHPELSQSNHLDAQFNALYGSELDPNPKAPGSYQTQAAVKTIDRFQSYLEQQFGAYVTVTFKKFTHETLTAPIDSIDPQLENFFKRRGLLRSRALDTKHTQELTQHFLRDVMALLVQQLGDPEFAKKMYEDFDSFRQTVLATLSDQIASIVDHRKPDNIDGVRNFEETLPADTVQAVHTMYNLITRVFDSRNPAIVVNAATTSNKDNRNRELAKISDEIRKLAKEANIDLTNTDGEAEFDKLQKLLSKVLNENAKGTSLQIKIRLLQEIFADSKESAVVKMMLIASRAFDRNSSFSDAKATPVTKKGQRYRSSYETSGDITSDLKLASLEIGQFRKNGEQYAQELEAGIQRILQKLQSLGLSYALPEPFTITQRTFEYNIYAAEALLLGITPESNPRSLPSTLDRLAEEHPYIGALLDTLYERLDTLNQRAQEMAQIAQVALNKRSNSTTLKTYIETYIPWEAAGAMNILEGILAEQPVSTGDSTRESEITNELAL